MEENGTLEGQGPQFPASLFAGYGTINQTPLLQPHKRTSPIYRTRNMVIDCYLDVIILQQVYEFSANLAATSHWQSSYDILAILYFSCISEKTLYLIDNIILILHVLDNWLSKCYNVATGS